MLLTEIDHIAIAVRDLDAAIDYYTRAVGAVVDHRETSERDNVEEAMIKVGSSTLQLLAPTSSDCMIARSIDQRGEGLHHIAYLVDDVQATIDAMVAAGATAIDKVPRPGTRGTTIAFVHPRGNLGTLVELVKYDEPRE
jgi:methylmalonyl-CoA/ethylmalonyl-CoA epimerase